MVNLDHIGNHWFKVIAKTAAGVLFLHEYLVPFCTSVQYFRYISLSLIFYLQLMFSLPPFVS